jgi:hypothetical protein
MNRLFLFSIITLFILPAAFADHNRFETGPNGNYRMEHRFAFHTDLNDAYSNRYNLRPSSDFFTDRYCGDKVLGASFYGVQQNGRCTSLYGRYGQFGILSNDESIQARDVRLDSTIRRSFGGEKRFLSREGTSRYYPTATRAGYPRDRSGRASYFYE